MDDKIADLLKKAELQENSDSAEQSSVTGAKRDFPNSEAAETAFESLKEKLFYIENWNAASGASSYAVFGINGENQFDKAMTIGDFIRISLKGAVKYDWVKIAGIHRALTEIVLTVQPSFDPTAEKIDENVTSHFFNDHAVNNFCLEKTDNSISFYVIGLNETTNTAETKNYLESIRNFMTTNIGTFLGIQKSEWKTFCENFLDIESSK